MLSAGRKKQGVKWLGDHFHLFLQPAPVKDFNISITRLAS